MENIGIRTLEGEEETMLIGGWKWSGLMLFVGMNTLGAAGGEDLWSRYPERPRLYLAEGEVEAFRDKLAQPPLDQWWPRFLQRCEEYQTPGAERWIDFRTREKEFWRTRNSVWVLPPAWVDLSLAYLATGEERYGTYARDLLLTVIRENVAEGVKGTNYGREYEGWGIRDGAQIAQGMAVAFDATYPLLTPEERALVAQHLYGFVEKVFVEHGHRPTGGAATNQSLEPMWGAALGMLTIWEEVEQPHFEEWMNYCIAECDNYLQVQVDEDGATYEGPGYGGVAAWICELGYVLRRAGWEDDLLARERLRRIPDFYLHALRPGGGHIQPFGQCFDALGGDVLLALAQAHRDRQARTAWDLYMQPDDPQGRLAQGKDWGAHSLLWYDPSVAPLPLADLNSQRQALFRGMGMLDVGTGWGPKDLRFCLTAGTGYCGGCPDKGAFTLDAQGEGFAVDIGYGSLPTERHSSLLIDGAGSPQGARIRERLVASDLNLPGAAYGRVDLTRSYRDSLRVWRHAAVVMEGAVHPWYVVIGDDLRMPEGEEHEFQWLLVTDEGNRFEVLGPDTVRVVGRKSNLDLKVVSPVEIEFRQDTIAHEWHGPDGRLLTKGNYPRLRIVARGTACRYLVVLYPADRPPEEAVPADDEGSFGVALKWKGSPQTLRFPLEAEPGEAGWSLERIPTVPSRLLVPPSDADCPASALAGILGAEIFRGHGTSPLGEGVQLLKITGEGLAQALGLAEGDVVLACGDSRTTCPMELLRALLQRDPEAACTLTVARGEDRAEFTFRTGPSSP